MQKAPSQFIVAARAQASRRCETQALLSGKPLALLLFRSLDPFHAYREPDRRRRDEEPGFPAPNKEPPTNQKHDLTGKAPYKRRVSNDLFRATDAECVFQHWVMVGGSSRRPLKARYVIRRRGPPTVESADYG